MNILFLSTENPFPVDHGHHIRTYHVLKCLAAEHTVHFVGFTDGDTGLNHIHELERMCVTAKIFPLPYAGKQQLVLAWRNLFSDLPLIAEKYYDPEVVAYIQRLVLEKHIDLVHIDLLHVARYIEKLNSIPGVLVNHNVESLRVLRWAKVSSNPLLKLFLKHQYRKLRDFESRICAAFDCCTAVSEYDKNILSEMCVDGNFETIPNGVDVDFFAPSTTRANSQSLVWTGSMQGPYNRDAVDYFLHQIWPLILQEVPAVSATFIGNKPTKELQRAEKQHENITATGYVDDIRPFVADSAVFIAPLRSGSGTKIKVLNAMAQAKPVVTTTIGAEGIEATPGKEIIIADSPRDFANETVRLLRNPEAAAQIGRSARKVIEAKYDWKIIDEAISRLYSQFDNHKIHHKKEKSVDL